MIAPPTEARNPAGSPSAYQPIPRPIACATKAPATPISEVMMNPPGSRPGINTFATIPTNKPINNVHNIVIRNFLSCWNLALPPLPTIRPRPLTVSPSPSPPHHQGTAKAAGRDAHLEVRPDFRLSGRCIHP